MHHEFLPGGQTVNKEYYLGVMRRLREAIPQNDRICGQTTRGFCTTITHRCTMPSLSVSIWLKTKLILFNNHQIHLIWLPATFSYSVDSRNRSAERVTAPEMRSWKRKAKGSKGSILKTITFNDYKQSLFFYQNLVKSQFMIRSKKHQVHTIQQSKVFLSLQDDKTMLLPGNTDTLYCRYNSKNKH